MFPALQLGCSLVAAPIAALGCVRLLLRLPPPHRQFGPWRGEATTVSPSASLFRKAYIARHALFAMGAPEAIYFHASHDSSGKSLEAAHTYSIRGEDPDTRWWSLTVYKDGHLIPNELHRYSFSKTNVSRGAGGSWTIRLSHDIQPANWLPVSAREGHLALLLRCYGPSSRLLDRPEDFRFPEILQEA